MFLAWKISQLLHLLKLRRLLAALLVAVTVTMMTLYKHLKFHLQKFILPLEENLLGVLVDKNTAELDLSSFGNSKRVSSIKIVANPQDAELETSKVNSIPINKRSKTLAIYLFQDCWGQVKKVFL